MSRLIYKGKSINFTSTGEGTPVILLHGFCEDSTIWNDFIQILPSRYQYITIDFPGFGQSEVVDAISIMQMAEIIHLIIQEITTIKPIIIGHSMGGYVALAYGEKYPTSIKGLGLFHSHPYPDSPEKSQNRHKQIEFIEKNGTIHFIKQLYANLFTDGFSRFNSLAYNTLLHKASQYPAEGITNALRAMANRPDRSTVLETINCPTLFIVGKKDTTISEEISQKQIVLADKALISIIPEAGHMGMFEASKKSAKAVTDFLNLCA